MLRTPAPLTGDVRLHRMDCWICGSPATSGEHIIKASDLRMVFGHVSQSEPLFLSNGTARNQRIPGIRSDKLKYSTLLCAPCNNERTQGHDRAWERLLAYLLNRKPAIKAGDIIKLEKVFPGRSRSSMLAVHLFFAKHFGCLIEEHKVPIDLAQFARCILTNTPHPNLFVGLWGNITGRKKNQAGQVPIQAIQRGKKVTFANWIYYIGPVAIQVIYSLEPMSHQRSGFIWHPNNHSKRLRVGDEA